MSLKPPLFTPPSVKSPLLKKTPDAIPPIHELELLRHELEELKNLSKARAKKAVDDLHTIQESMRRMREKEKGKARAVEKVKRERDCTCVSRRTRSY
jgi:transcriptional adapter 3